MEMPQTFPWIPSLIKCKRSECLKHPHAVKSKANIFCITCQDTNLHCKYCVQESHCGHKMLQLKLASYRECVAPCELEGLGLDLSGIKCDFKINSKPIIFLNSKEKSKEKEDGGKKSVKGGKLISKDCSCKFCGKYMYGNFKFCSLGCKYKSSTIGADTTLEVQKSCSHGIQDVREEAGPSIVRGDELCKKKDEVVHAQKNKAKVEYKKTGEVEHVPRKIRSWVEYIQQKRGGVQHVPRKTRSWVAYIQQKRGGVEHVPRKTRRWGEYIQKKRGGVEHVQKTKAKGGGIGYVQKKKVEDVVVENEGGARMEELTSVGIAKEKQVLPGGGIGYELNEKVEDVVVLKERGARMEEPTSVGISKERQVLQGCLTSRLDERYAHANVLEQCARFIPYGRFRMHKIFEKEAEQSPTVIDFGRFSKYKMFKIQADEFPGLTIEDTSIEDWHSLPVKKRKYFRMANIDAENVPVKKKRTSQKSNMQAENSRVSKWKTSNRSSIQAQNSRVRTGSRPSQKSNMQAENFQGPDMNVCDASVLRVSSTLVPSSKDKDIQGLRVLHERDGKASEMSHIQAEKFSGPDIYMCEENILRIPSPHVPSVNNKITQDVHRLSLKKRPLAGTVQKLPVGIPSPHVPSFKNKIIQDVHLLPLKKRPLRETVRKLPVDTPSPQVPSVKNKIIQDVHVLPLEETDSGHKLPARIPSPHVASFKDKIIQELRRLPLKKRRTIEEIVKTLPVKKRASFERAMQSVRYVDRTTLKTPLTYGRSTLTYAGKEGEVVEILPGIIELLSQ